MIAEDEDALICDMAETYGIYDLESLPVFTIARLACGLREDSRIVMLMSGRKAGIDTMLLAMAVDRLSMLVWAKTKDAQKSRNRPKAIAPTFAIEKKKALDMAFDSPDDFMAARQKLISRGGGAGGN